MVSPLTACSQGNEDSRSARRAIAQSQAIASDFLQTELALSPETASRLGLERLLGPGTSQALDNHSQAGFERRRLVRIELLQRLRQRPRLPEGHVLVRDLAIAERALLDLISLEQLGYGRYNYSTMRPFALDPFSGIWIEGPNLLAFRQTINTADEATAFVSRLQSLTAAVDDTRRRVVADKIAGIRLPAPLLFETEQRLQSLLNAPDNPLASISRAFNALIRDVPDLELEDRERLAGLVEVEIEERLRPAYARLLETLADHASETADQLGVWAQPSGEALFVGILKASTGEQVSLERLHDRHLSAVETRRNAVEAMIALEPMDDEVEFEPADDLSARLNLFAASLELEQAALSAPTEPAVQTPADPLQALIPATVWDVIADQSRFSDQALTIRQFQTLLETHPYLSWRAIEQNDQPTLRDLLEYPAIADAWRMSVWESRLSPPADGSYSMSDVAARRLGLIQASLAAADTGIHLERWTLEQAIVHIQANTGLDADIARILALRVAARPGHQTAVLSAMNRFEGLEERARAVLGDRYSNEEFQRTLVQNGPRPLDMIEIDIEAWYGERLAN